MFYVAYVTCVTISDPNDQCYVGWRGSSVMGTFKWCKRKCHMIYTNVQKKRYKIFHHFYKTKRHILFGNCKNMHIVLSRITNIKPNSLKQNVGRSIVWLARYLIFRVSMCVKIDVMVHKKVHQNLITNHKHGALFLVQFLKNVKNTKLDRKESNTEPFCIVIVWVSSNHRPSSFYKVRRICD